MTTASRPFAFKTELSLVTLTGLKAGNLLELRRHLEAAPEAAIYYHTYNFLKHYQFLTPEPPNDFAYWVVHVLRENSVGERLMAVDPLRFRSLEELRRALMAVLDAFLKKEPKLREAPPGEEFCFMKSVLFVLPTSIKAKTLQEFMEGLGRVSIHSIYYHMFEARLRRPGTNDFSEWLEQGLEDADLARAFEKLDLYRYTIEELRAKMMALVDKRLKEEVHAAA